MCLHNTVVLVHWVIVSTSIELCHDFSLFENMNAVFTQKPLNLIQKNHLRYPCYLLWRFSHCYSFYFLDVLLQLCLWCCLSSIQSTFLFSKCWFAWTLQVTGSMCKGIELLILPNFTVSFLDFNPWCPNSDQNEVFLYISTTSSNIQAMRINEVMTKDKMSWYLDKFSLLHNEKCMENWRRICILISGLKGFIPLFPNS